MINEEPKRVNIDFPAWMVQSLDKEAKHVGVSRQAVIKMWLAEKLQSLNAKTFLIRKGTVYGLLPAKVLKLS